MIRWFKQKFVDWLFDGTKVHNLEVGENSVRISDMIAISNINPTVVGQIGMDTATGRIKMFVGGAAISAAHLNDVGFRTINGGRITLTTGSPVASPDASGLTVYFTPYSSDQISLYDGAQWQVLNFTEKSVTLAGTLVDKNYDIFGYASGSDVVLEVGSGWFADTTRGVDAAVTSLNGVRVRSSANTRRLLGTIRTFASGVSSDSLSNRFVINEDNKVNRSLYTNPGYGDADTISTYSLASTTYAELNAAVSSRVKFLSDGESVVDITFNAIVANDQAGQNEKIGIGIDSVTSPAICTNSDTSDANFDTGMSVRYVRVLAEGAHFAAMLARSTAGTMTISADQARDGAAADPPATALAGSILA